MGLDPPTPDQLPAFIIGLRTLHAQDQEETFKVNLQDEAFGKCSICSGFNMLRQYSMHLSSFQV